MKPDEKMEWYNGRVIAVSQGLGQFNSKKSSFHATSAFFGTARVKANPGARLRAGKEAGDAHQIPWSVFAGRVFHKKITALPPEAEAVRKSVAVREILEGPIREAGVRNDGAEMAGSFGFKLSRCLQPAFGGKAYHQARLVVLMGGMTKDGCRRNGVAVNLGVQEVTVIRAEAIVSLLPEVGWGIRLKQKTRAGAVNAPCRWRVHPLEKRVKRRAIESFIQQRVRHRFAPT